MFVFLSFVQCCRFYAGSQRELQVTFPELHLLRTIKFGRVRVPLFYSFTSGGSPPFHSFQYRRFYFQFSHCFHSMYEHVRISPSSCNWRSLQDSIDKFEWSLPAAIAQTIESCHGYLFFILLHSNCPRSPLCRVYREG